MIINQLRIAVDRLKTSDRSGKVSHEEMELIRQKLCHTLRVKDDDIERVTVLKKSIDARKKHKLCLIYNVDVRIKGQAEDEVYVKKVFEPVIADMSNTKVVVVGAGPAGLFCTYILALNGVRPILIEQGSAMERRIEQTERFFKDCTSLNPYSNVVFGEGGAGTFSDGKLNTAVKDKTGIIAYIKKVFVEHGAPEEILYLDKPHIGTDELRHVIVNIRKDIERLGGKVCFDTCMTDITVKGGRIASVKAVRTNHKLCTDHTLCMDSMLSTDDTLRTDHPEKCVYECDSLVLATGHSARNTYEFLKNILQMQAKDFAIGLRVQHPQKFIDNAQYGDMANLLPPADYKLRYHTEKNRAVYSFCMCPGGYVVNTSTEPGHTVVNGMSNHKRDSKNANSAIVVNVTKDDFDGDDVLAGVDFQRKWEKKAYEEAHGNIPVQCLGDYKKDARSTHINKIDVVVKGTYSFANLRNTLPEFVNEAIIEAMDYFDGVIDGYGDDDVILCGVETRTSAPVRIVRDETFQSNVRGVYPCGEGAGYAGGIMSAAVDGVKVAHAVLQ